MYGKKLYDARLPNGTRVIVHPVPLPDVGIGILTPFGYMFETQEEIGITHLMEHIIFRGNEFYDYRTINRLMKRYGGTGRFNAETRGTHALYHAQVLHRDYIPAWRLLSSMVFHSIFPPHAVEREKTIVGKELIALEDDPEFLAMRELMQSVYPTHPAHNDVTENIKNTKRLSRTQILARYREFYRPSGSLVVFVGDVTPKKIYDLVCALPDNDGCPNALPLFEETRPPRFRDRRVFKKDLLNAFIAFGFRAPSIRDKEFAAMRILEYILVHGFDSPLKQFVREQSGCAYHTPNEYSYSHCHGLFYLAALISPRDVTKVARLIHRAVRSVQRTVTRDQFLLNRRALLNDLEMSKGSAVQRIKFLGETAILGGSLDRELITQIMRVTRDEVVEAARTFLDLDKAVEVIVRPN